MNTIAVEMTEATRPPEALERAFKEGDEAGMEQLRINGRKGGRPKRNGKV